MLRGCNMRAGATVPRWRLGNLLATPTCAMVRGFSTLHPFSIHACASACSMPWAPHNGCRAVAAALRAPCNCAGQLSTVPGHDGCHAYQAMAEVSVVQSCACPETRGTPIYAIASQGRYGNRMSVSAPLDGSACVLAPGLNRAAFSLQANPRGHSMPLSF